MRQLFFSVGGKTMEISGKTVLTGLLGSPVAHSISPAMHNAAFQELDLDYVYLAFDVGREGLASAVAGMRALGVRGFNLTMPLKNDMAALCDRLSPAAELSGAVNTVVNDNGILTGHTTDGIGYMEAARDAGFPLESRVMTLLGGGGAAVSICTQAALDGMKEIRVFNRRGANLERMQVLADKLTARTSCRVTVMDLADEQALYDSIQGSDILTNATSVGMAPREKDCLIRDKDVLRPSLIVSDVIYHPEETMLLKMGKENGCRTFNGLYMLLYQGAAAFQLWTGEEMPVPVIKERFFRR